MAPECDNCGYVYDMVITDEDLLQGLVCPNCFYPVNEELQTKEQE